MDMKDKKPRPDTGNIIENVYAAVEQDKKKPTKTKSKPPSIQSVDDVNRQSKKR
jgi:hypothetical protein